jgi:hypothetical protein
MARTLDHIELLTRMAAAVIGEHGRDDNGLFEGRGVGKVGVAAFDLIVDALERKLIALELCATVSSI